MPTKDCGVCNLVTNCGGAISDVAAFQTATIRLLCELNDNLQGVIDVAGPSLLLDGSNQASWNPTSTLVSNLNADKLDGLDVGTSGAAIGALNAINTWGAKQIFPSVDITNGVHTTYIDHTQITTTLAGFKIHSTANSGYIQINGGSDWGTTNGAGIELQGVGLAGAVNILAADSATGVVRLRAVNTSASVVSVIGSTTICEIKSTGAYITGITDSSNGFADGGTPGVDGSFLDQGGNTITVSGGIITGLS